MRVIEHYRNSNEDQKHARAFAQRRNVISRFVDGVNLHSDFSVSLLAVRDFNRFTFVLTDESGSVVAVARPVTPVNGSGDLTGVALVLTDKGRAGATEVFGFDTHVEAAAFLSEPSYSPVRAY